MKKRILALLLCLATVLSLFACGEDGALSTDSVDGDTDVIFPQFNKKPTQNSDENSDAVDPYEAMGYDPAVDHKFIACDIINHSVVVFDLNACDGDFQNLKDDDVAVVWEWDSDEDPNCKIKPGYGIDSAKYRYSPYYKKDVIIACSSGGGAWVVDYEEKTVLWEARIGGGPHSIEMLPNGDIVVAGSSGGPKQNGHLTYVPLSAGIKKPVSTIASYSCHGVSWDPVNECLWVLEYDCARAVAVLNEGTKNAELVRIDRSGCNFPGGGRGGHAFSPVIGQPGKYWASSGNGLWQFDAEAEEMYSNYPLNVFLTTSGIKGVCSFADGTVIETVAGIGNETQSWSSNGFLIVTQDADTKEVKSEYVVFDHRDFYKVQPFTKDYQ